MMSKPVGEGTPSVAPAEAHQARTRGALRMGLDIGSTTVKLVFLDDDAPEAKPLRAEYRRHNADVRGEVTRLLGEVAAAFPNREVRGAVTGSAGVSLATLMGLPFVQEVIAETEMVRVMNVPSS